jgi:hypothetical protein
MMSKPLSITALGITVLTLGTITAKPANATGFDVMYDIFFSGTATLHEPVSEPFPAEPKTVVYENVLRQGTLHIPPDSQFSDVLDLLDRNVHGFDPFSYGNHVTFSGNGTVNSIPYRFAYNNNQIALQPEINSNTCITQSCNLTSNTQFSVSDPTGKLLIDGQLNYSGEIKPIPTPALLPGLLGLGVSVWRKRRSAAAASAQSSPA